MQRKRHRILHVIKLVPYFVLVILVNLGWEDRSNISIFISDQGICFFTYIWHNSIVIYGLGASCLISSKAQYNCLDFFVGKMTVGQFGEKFSSNGQILTMRESVVGILPVRPGSRNDQRCARNFNMMYYRVGREPEF